MADPFSRFHASLNYIPSDFPHQEVLFDTIHTADAQSFLHRIGWTYYTIWRKAEPSLMLPPNVPNLPGLVWSKGDVNSSPLGADDHEQRKACSVAWVLQQFYQQCSWLPLEMGIAGRAESSKKRQWSSGYELLQQVSIMSMFNDQPMPPDLQAQIFQTVVCIPLQEDAGVLEIGSRMLRDKITILKRTIDYLKEMEARISCLEQKNNALINQTAEEPKHVVAETSCMSEMNATINACKFHHSSSKSHSLPHFELDMNVRFNNGDVNSSIVKVVEALQQKGLHCFDFKMEVQQQQSILYAKILAHYEDNSMKIPTYLEIQGMEEWWSHFIRIMLD